MQIRAVSRIIRFEGEIALKEFFRNTWKHRAHVVMALPAFLILLFIMYVPMSGLVMAFKNFNYAQGIFMNYDLGYDRGDKDGASGVLLAIAYNESFFDTIAYGAASGTFTTSKLDRLNDML